MKFLVTVGCQILRNFDVPVEAASLDEACPKAEAIVMKEHPEFDFYEAENCEEVE